MKVMCDFHTHGLFPRGSNASFLMLIPKKDIIQDFGDYRPISLIGYLYKIVAKVLALRMSRVLHKVVEETQSGLC